MSQYFQINWVNGMKITSNHFIELENHFIDRTQHIAKGFVSELSYGLLPPEEPGMKPPGFQLSLQEGKVKVLGAFSVLTADGHVVSIPEKKEFLLSKPEADARRYVLILAIKPYGRSPHGEINELETPLRYPYCMADCQFHLFPYPHQSQHSFGNAMVPLAMYAEGSYEPDYSFIPPCTSIQSHPILIELATKAKAAFEEFERRILETFRKQNVPNRPVMENLLRFFNDNKAAIDWYIPYLPPVYLLEVINKVSRVIYFTSEIQNFQLKSDDKKLLEDIISFQYDHLEIFKAVQKVKSFIDNYAKFLPRDENIFSV
jgi:predicted component of type VI protein secretion system